MENFRKQENCPSSLLTSSLPLIQENDEGLNPIINLSFPHPFEIIDQKPILNKRIIKNYDYGYWVKWGSLFIEEVKKQVWLAGPLILAGLCTFSLHVISLMFVGHLGELPLSAASLGTSFAYVTGFSVLLGMSSALETLCGQSYGAEQFKMVGIHTQTAMLVLILACIPVAIIWAYTKLILINLGQHQQIATQAASYVQFMIPSLIPYSMLQCLFRFLQTQNMVFPMVLSCGVTTLFHFVICWALVFKSGLGSRGAALANGVSYWLNLIILALFIKFSSSCSKTWKGFSLASLRGIPTFLRLCIPSTAMICLEFWSFEMIVLLSGYLPNPLLETSALAISLNLISMVWVIPEGLSGAVSTRVSNELGAANPQAAKLAVCVVLSITICESIIVGAILLMVRDVLGYAYSKDLEVVKYLATMMPLLIVANCFTGVACVLSGIARGCGWQKIGAYISVASFYLMGLPVSILLAFFMHIGGKGLWLGFIFAFSIQVLSLTTITMKTNWEKEANKAMDRVLEAKFYEDTIPIKVVDIMKEVKNPPCNEKFTT